MRLSPSQGCWNLSGLVDADGADAFHTAVVELLRTTPTLRLRCHGLELMDVAGMQMLAKAAGAVPGAADEEPFANRVQDVPITALAINLERDLLELIDVPDRPAEAVPVDGYLW